MSAYVFDLVAQRLGRALQEVSVAGRALRVQLEILNPPVFQDDELDVLAAHVDDNVRLLIELHRRLGVRDGFHQRHIGLQHVLQNVLGVAGRAHAHHFQGRALRFHLLAQCDKHVDGVLDGIAARQLVGLAHHVAVFGEQHGLRRRRSAVESDKSADHSSRRKRRAHELRDAILFFELSQFCVRGAQAGGAGLRLLRLASNGDVVLQALGAHVDADFGLFILAKLDCTQRREILRVLRDLDQSSGLSPSGICTLRSSQVRGMFMLPGFLHAADELNSVRPATARADAVCGRASTPSGSAERWRRTAKPSADPAECLASAGR